MSSVVFSYYLVSLLFSFHYEFSYGIAEQNANCREKNLAQLHRHLNLFNWCCRILRAEEAGRTLAEDQSLPPVAEKPEEAERDSTRSESSLILTNKMVSECLTQFCFDYSANFILISVCFCLDGHFWSDLKQAYSC